MWKNAGPSGSSHGAIKEQLEKASQATHRATTDRLLEYNMNVLMLLHCAAKY